MLYSYLFSSLYFDSCDGIFLNYTWSVEQLSNSSIHAGESRKFDVYVGVDCFGRGCFGGGGWDTYQVKLSRKGMFIIHASDQH